MKSVWITSLYGSVNRSPVGGSDCRQRARREVRFKSDAKGPLKENWQDLRDTDKIA